MTTTTARPTTQEQTFTSKGSGKVARRNFLLHIVLAITGVLFAFPLFWTVSSSLQTWQELRSFTPHLLPEVPQWENYTKVFSSVPYARWMLNSFIIVAITIPGTVITASLTAYAFARFNFKGRDFWFILMLGTMMIPTQVTLIPQYILFFNLKLVNTFIPLTIGAWLGGGAFMIFLLRQFIMSIPRDLDEAALIDGATPLRILLSVLMPLMKPALTTVAILQFLADWNEFFAPFIYLSRIELFTAAVGLRFFQHLPMETTEPREHLLMAAAAIMTVPVLLLFAVAQRYFIQGVVLSGLKI
jgi:multiple sugar transport system permease protein